MSPDQLICDLSGTLPMPGTATHVEIPPQRKSGTTNRQLIDDARLDQVPIALDPLVARSPSQWCCTRDRHYVHLESPFSVVADPSQEIWQTS